MTATARLKQIQNVLDVYRRLLDEVDETRFTELPPGGGWSFAEVYSHIMQATLGSIGNLERCTQRHCKPTGKKLNWAGRVVMLFGRFPPGRYKQPKVVAETMPAQRISKEDARNFIIKCRQKLDAVVAALHRPENNGRMAHPRLGMLNARQWLKFISIHLKHHLKQLQRIKNNFAG